MDLTYKMRGELDCGPAAVSFATGIDYQKVIDAWNWPKTDDWRCNLRDSPGAHFRVLRKLGIPWRVVTLGEILGGKLPHNKVIALIHAHDDPDTWLPEGILQQHWVVLDRVFVPFLDIPAGIPHENWRGTVTAHMGNNGTSLFTHESFTALYAGGWPACVYVIGEHEITTWDNPLERSWDWLMEKTING